MEILLSNLGKGVRRESRNGVDYLVAPLSLIVPGTLNGSNGAIYYPSEENQKYVDQWNGIPLVVYHPTQNGRNVSARTPDIAFKSKVGRAYNSYVDESGIQRAEGWFSIDALRRVDNRILEAIKQGKPVELSTGLYIDREPAPANSTDSKGRPYHYIARNYKADHIAILPDQRGACSVEDGCGVGVVNVEAPSVEWVTLNKKAKSDEEDDGDFSSDDQRRAFFGKLKAGKIGSTKRTKQIPKKEEPTPSSTEKKDTTESPKEKPSLLERMKSSGRKDIPNPSVGDIRPLATPGPLATTPKKLTQEEEEFEDYKRTPDRSKFLSMPKEKQQRLREYAQKSFRESESSRTPGTDPHSVGERIRDEYLRKLSKATTDKERNQIKHWYESQLHIKRIKATTEGWKTFNTEQDIEYGASSNEEWTNIITDAVKETLNQRPSDISPEKACKILHDKEVHGHPLTDKQRKLFGAICSKRTTNTENLEWLNLNFSPDQPRDNRGRFTRKAIASLPEKKQSLFRRVLAKFGIGKEKAEEPHTPIIVKTRADKVVELKQDVRKQKSLLDSLQRHVDSRIREINHTRAMGGRVTKKLEKSLATAERQKERADKKYNSILTKLLDYGGSMEGDTPPVSVGKMKHKQYTAISLRTNSEVREGDEPEDHLYNLLCLLEDELGRPLEESEIDSAVEDYLDSDDEDEGTYAMNSYDLRWVNLTTNENSVGSTVNENCGIGKDGFQRGNTCAKGSGGSNPTGANPEGGHIPTTTQQRRQNNIAQAAYRAIEPTLGKATFGVLPTVIGVASGGRAGGRVNREAVAEAKDIFRGIFSRMTLGVGPLLAKGIAAGIRHSPKAFGLLSKAFMAIMPRKRIQDKAQPLGENPESGQSRTSGGSQDFGQAGMGASRFSPEKTRKSTRNVATDQHGSNTDKSKKPPHLDERGVARAKMYLDQLAQLLKDNPDELEKLIVACKEAMKVLPNQPQPTSNLEWVNLN